MSFSTALSPSRSKALAPHSAVLILACQELTAVGHGRGEYGLTGQQSSLFFIFYLTVWWAGQETTCSNHVLAVHNGTTPEFHTFAACLSPMLSCHYATFGGREEFAKDVQEFSSWNISKKHTG